MDYNTNLETFDTSENPGKDPNNKYYLKFCFVCQEEAKPDQVSIISNLRDLSLKLDQFPNRKHLSIMVKEST
jgi:hypothetical protein